MISIRNLSKSFDGKPVWENVNLTIEKGETVVIIGGSGGGKEASGKELIRWIFTIC